jgi:histidinol-phosphatase (PHP family)
MDAVLSGAAGVYGGLTDYHVHTPLCRHATGWPTEYALRAREMGFREIGFADHSPMREPFDDWRMLIEELPRYVEEVERARDTVPEVRIRMGLEVDFLRGSEGWVGELAGMADWDFLIGSVHYLPEGWEVDNPKYLRRYREEDPERIWSEYWTVYREMVLSGLFDFVGHPDLPKKFGIRPTGDLGRFYGPVIEAMALRGVAFELNTAGLRKECQEVYPEPAFLRMAFEAGVPCLMNSDAHAVSELGADFCLGLRLLRAAGYRELCRFEGRQRTFVELPAEVGGA